MSKRTLLFTSVCAWLVSAGATSLFVACGSSSNGNSPGTDAGGGDGSSKDSGVDTGMSMTDSGGTDTGSGDDGGQESSTGDGGCTVGSPVGTQIVKSASAVAEGVTVDGNVIWYDATAKNLMYVPIAGGTSSVIGAWDASGQLLVGGNAVFYWNGATAASATAPGHGALSVWTKAGGNHVIGTMAYVDDVDLSDDGTKILYFDHASASTVEIWEAGVDGSNPTKLAGNVAYNATTCVPSIQYVKNTATAAFCTNGVTSEAGAGFSATIEAFTSPAQIFTTEGFTGYNSDHNSNIVFVDATGMYVQAIGGSTPTLIDKAGGIGIFTNAGTDILYLQAGATAGGPLMRAPATGGTLDDAGSSGTLVANGTFIGFSESISTLPGSIRTIPALSSDDKYVYVFSTSSSSLPGAGDMWVTATAPGSTPKHLVTTATALLQGDAFTADNNYATFYGNATLQGNNAFVADFESEALPPTGMPSDFAQLVWQNYSEATGAKVIYNDNYSAGAGVSSNGRADVKVRDVSMNTGSTLVVAQADANLWMTQDRSKLVYSWNVCAGNQTGVYVTAAP